MRKVLFSIGAIQILIILINMCRAKILSLLLGPAGFGIISTIDQVVLTVSQLAGFSLPFISLKFLSRSHSEGSLRFQSTFSSFLKGIIGVSIFATALALVLVIWKPDAIGTDLVPYKKFLILALFGIPSLMLGIFFIHTLAALQRSSSSVLLNFFVTLCLAVAACVGAWLGKITGLYYATIYMGLLTTIGTLIYLRKIFNLRSFSASAGILKELKHSPEIITFSIMTYFAVSSYSIAMLVARYYVFSNFGEEIAGMFQAVLSISLAVGAISGPMNTLYLTPIVNRTISNQEKLNAAHHFQKNIIIILVLLALPMLLYPKLSLIILFSSEFISASQALFLFILWQCLYIIVNVYQQLLIGMDDVLYYSITTALGFILVIVLSPLLVPLYGLSGVAISFISGIAFNGILTDYRLRSRFRSGIPRSVWIRILFCLISILMTGLIFNRIDELTQIGFAYRIGYIFIFLIIIWFLQIKNQREYAFNYKNNRSL